MAASICCFCAGSAGATELPGVTWKSPGQEPHYEAALYQIPQGFPTATGQLPNLLWSTSMRLIYCRIRLECCLAILVL